MRSLPSRQRGMSIFGFVLIGALVLAAAFVAFQAAPAYTEYFTVKKVLNSTMSRVTEGQTPYDIRRNFDLAASADYIESVRGQDVEFLRENNQYVARVSWERKIHIVGNAYLLLEFEASAAK